MSIIQSTPLQNKIHVNLISLSLSHVTLPKSGIICSEQSINWAIKQCEWTSLSYEWVESFGKKRSSEHVHPNEQFYPTLLTITIHRLSLSSKSRRRMVFWRRCKQENLSYYFPL